MPVLQFRIIRPLLVLAALGLFGLSGCRKEQEDDAYPIWFLGVDVTQFNEEGAYQPVEGCPRLYWRYALIWARTMLRPARTGAIT